MQSHKKRELGDLSKDLNQRIFNPPHHHHPSQKKTPSRKTQKDWGNHWIAVENPLWFVHASPEKDKALLKWNNLLLREKQGTERMVSSTFQGGGGCYKRMEKNMWLLEKENKQKKQSCS